MSNSNHGKNIIVAIFVISIALSGCSKAEEIALPPTPTPLRVLPTYKILPGFPDWPTPTYIPNTKFKTISIWTSPQLSMAFQHTLPGLSRFIFVKEPRSDSIKLEISNLNRISQWVYALVTPFPTILNNISSKDLLLYWQGENVGPLAGNSILLDESTLEMLSAIWGPGNSSNIKILKHDELVDYAWAHQPALAIVPFEELNPRWKVLSIDGISPLHKDFDLNAYPLKIPISISGDPDLIELVNKNFPIPFSNRDPNKFTIVAMTGVTALVRATAYTMELQGNTYPSQDIREWLQNADITHISNEVPFAENCPAPNPVQASVQFCSRDSYIELLEDVGTDVVELSGDHFHDWGQEAVFHTLDLYRQRGWQYYGGGTNLAEGRNALLIEHNRNKIAFIGCNAKGASFARASETNPGAAACDMEWMASEITRLEKIGYLVIATFQHQEYYTYLAHADQKSDFGMMAQAGAVIVSGSQAHQPQGMEFLNNSFIHYGLGNLFFDQYGLCPACIQATIDFHVFYDGRYIGTELLPIQFIDYARSRPMTVEEANNLLESLFSASGW
jgi:poly-gamma-glutamate synthesis protein (capsule biosynthesis protein)